MVHNYKYLLAAARLRASYYMVKMSSKRMITSIEIEEAIHYNRKSSGGLEKFTKVRVSNTV